MENRKFKNQNFQNFAPSSLDPNHEIRMDYDADGTLVRIYVVERTNGCLTSFIVLMIIGCFILFFIAGSF